MLDAMAADSFKWSYSDISANSVLLVEDGINDKLASNTDKREFIYFLDHSIPRKESFMLSTTIL